MGGAPAGAGAGAMVSEDVRDDADAGLHGADELDGDDRARQRCGGDGRNAGDGELHLVPDADGQDGAVYGERNQGFDRDRGAVEEAVRSGVGLSVESIQPAGAGHAEELSAVGRQHESREVVLEVLNKIAAEPSIYSSSLFEGVALTEETLCLLHQSPENVELSHVNRLLLQDPYTKETTRRHLEGVGALVHEEVHVVQQYGGGRRSNPPGSLAFGDITNYGLLVQKLQKEGDPVSAFLNIEMTPGERKALTDYKGPGPTDYYSRTNLVAALNRFIKGPCLYDAALFKGVTLRDETKSALGEKPEGSDLARLNRALLEDAYPAELVRPVAATGGGGGGGGRGRSNTGWLTEGIPDYIRWYTFAIRGARRGPGLFQGEKGQPAIQRGLSS